MITEIVGHNSKQKDTSLYGITGIGIGCLLGGGAGGRFLELVHDALLLWHSHYMVALYVCS